MLAELLQSSETVDELRGKVPRMRSDEPDPFYAIDRIDLPQQFRKRDVIPRVII